MNFPRIICEQWHHENVVLMGDAAATAHFSIGSGTRLAFDSAIALAEYLHSEPTMEAAFERYQAERRLEVLRLQSAARNSLEWFEQVERYLDLDPVQFNYSLLTRSQRISHENLRIRDPEWLRSAEDWFQAQAGGKPGRAPMFAPFRLRGLELQNRVVVSPMAQYKAVDGCPTDWHFVHYAERAKGGAGLVYTEMTCVSPEGRITPGCTGLYAPRARGGVETAHRLRPCRDQRQDLLPGRPLGTQGLDPARLGADRHSAAATATGRSCRPRRSRGHPWSAIPKEMDRDDMDAVTAQFVASTEMVQRAGFDMIELHAAHGYLISSFISPVSNQRLDEYGGTLDGRHAVPARGLHRDACRLAGRQADVGQDLGQRLGGRRTASHPTRRSRSLGCSREQAPTSSTYRPDRPRSTPSPCTGGCSRRRSPTGSATRRGSPRWRWATSTNPTTSTRS